jgi:hypothetical protein
MLKGETWVTEKFQFNMQPQSQTCKGGRVSLKNVAPKSKTQFENGERKTQLHF